jgi:hypothetical protein
LLPACLCAVSVTLALCILGRGAGPVFRFHFMIRVFWAYKMVKDLLNITLAFIGRP